MVFIKKGQLTLASAYYGDTKTADAGILYRAQCWRNFLEQVDS